MKKLYYSIFAFFFIVFAQGILPGHALAFDATDSIQAARTDSPYTSRLNLHFQSTYIYQYKPSFDANYTGRNSLTPIEEKKNSITATLYFGSKLWKGGEFYVNPELAGGAGLSGAFGMGAASNGETFRVGDPAPTLYLARCFFAQTFRFGHEDDNSFAPEGANETGGYKPNDYIKFYAGKMSLGDLFDNNACANSPRNQFINWCLMNNGAWDYAADLRGYTYAFVTVLQKGNMMYKAALATLPVVANGIDLNTNLGQEYSINAEVDKTYAAGVYKRRGNIRILGYYNNGHMGNYAIAQQHPDSAGIPDVTGTRIYGRTKTGIGLSIDQQINGNATAFLRAGWSDGQNETWCFTEVDECISGGVSVKGSPWKRNDDNLGAAIDVNGLSKSHRNYLSAGGYGFEIGDGALSYANETLLEAFYNYKPPAFGFWLTLDYQFILNPGYNSARGPVNVLSFRLHVEL